MHRRTLTHTHMHIHTHTHEHNRAAGIIEIAEPDASAAVYPALFLKHLSPKGYVERWTDMIKYSQKQNKLFYLVLSVA